MSQWKEQIFYFMASAFYLAAMTLVLAWPHSAGDVWVRIILAIGSIANQVVLIAMIFRYDIDNGKNREHPADKG